MKLAPRKETMTYGAVIVLILFAGVLSGAAVYAHGGKSHDAGGEFTNLDALKKALELYDKLIATNKLDVSWETGVDTVQIAERRKGAEIEKVVALSKTAGEPKAVYIFFTSRGEYAGSNFTGQ